MPAAADTPAEVPFGAATPVILPIAGSTAQASPPLASTQAPAAPLAPTVAPAIQLPLPPSVVYTIPVSGSAHNPPQTTVALRYGVPLDAQNVAARFSVSGSASGAHDGKIVLADDRQTLIFRPAQAFVSGETVQVSVEPWTAPSGAAFPAVSFDFSVGSDTLQPASTTGQLVTQNSMPYQPGQGAIGPTSRYATLPADFPTITVTVPASGTAPGLTFASNFQLSPGPAGYYLLILDNAGDPVYYQKLAANSRVLDFKAQPDGTLTYADDARGAFIVLDKSYHEIGTITPGNGYQWFDEHDLQVLPNGHYLLMANEVRPMDLSKVVSGGNPKAEVTAQVVQELDRDKNVIFQWRVLDHIPITETSQSLADASIDFSHANSLDLDPDGNLLLSSRHLDEITKIDRRSGAIIWRLGGKGNQFALSLAPGLHGPAEFYHQHDVRRLPNGHITVFDNHNDQQPQVSRALEYAVDESARTATLVWEWQTDPPPYAIAMGNTQRLANGNTFIGWGTNGAANVDEVTPDGKVAFELDFGGSNVTYRAFRLPWHGYPTWPPALIARVSNDALTLAFSWNGATEVTGYWIYGGNSSPPGNLVAGLAKGGFETRLTVPDAGKGYCFYQVVPIDVNGDLGQPSAVVQNPAADPSACSVWQ